MHLLKQFSLFFNVSQVIHNQKYDIEYITMVILRFKEFDD